jgi:S1-C subfamily serine protease
VASVEVARSLDIHVVTMELRLGSIQIGHAHAQKPFLSLEFERKVISTWGLLMKRIVAIVFVWAGLFSCAPSNAAGPFGTIHLGGWHGGAYTNDADGSFSHCAALSSYASGISLLVSYNVKNQWLLAFASSKFHLTKGETFPIDLTFDGESQVRLFGTALSDQLLSAIMVPNALRDFKKATLMVAVAKGATFQFALSSTGPLLPALSNCVTRVKAAGVDHAGDFSVAAANPSGEAKPPATSEQKAADSAKPDKLVGRNGTGFVVSQSGHIVTNNHVVDGCVGDIQGNLSGEAQVPLRVVSTDKNNDLALLQGPAGSFKAMASIRDKPIRSGDSVVAIGYPYHGLLTSDFTVTTGIVSSLSGILNDTRFLQISAAVQPGNSGGPLLDSKGQVVGIVAAKLNALKFASATGTIPENINFAIKPGALRDFLDNSVVPYQTSDSQADLGTPDIAKNARDFTLLISCMAASEKSKK